MTDVITMTDVPKEMVMEAIQDYVSDTPNDYAELLMGVAAQLFATQGLQKSLNPLAAAFASCFGIYNQKEIELDNGQVSIKITYSDELAATLEETTAILRGAEESEEEKVEDEVA